MFSFSKLTQNTIFPSPHPECGSFHPGDMSHVRQEETHQLQKWHFYVLKQLWVFFYLEPFWRLCSFLACGGQKNTKATDAGRGYCVITYFTAVTWLSPREACVGSVSAGRVRWRGCCLPVLVARVGGPGVIGVVASGLGWFFFLAQLFIILRASCRDDFPRPFAKWWQGLNYHRITAWQGLEGTSGGHLLQPSC